MKKFIYSLPLLSILFGACGGNSDASPDTNIDYYPVQEENDGKWGLVGKNGEILFSEEFKNQPSPAVNGVFYVKENNNYVLYKAGQKPKTIPGCDNLYTVGYLMEDVIPVSRKGERITLVNSNGELQATLNQANGKEIIYARPYFSDGVLIVQDEDYKYGLVNKKGEFIIEPKYDDINDFACGVSLISKKTEDSYKKIVINTKGEEVFTLKNNYDPMSYQYKDGYLPVRDENRYGFLDTKGEYIKLPGKVEGIGDYNSKYFIFRESSEWGIMKLDKDNQEIIVKARYGAIKILPNDKFLIADDKEYFVINKNGDKEFEFDDDYKYVEPVEGSSFHFIGYDKNRRAVLLDDKGKPINKLEFISFRYVISGMTIVSDYFSVDSYVQDLLSEVTVKGIGKYYIGEPASELGYEANSNTPSYQITNEDLNKTGYRYNIEFRGRTDYRMVKYDYDYNPYSGSNYKYYFNPDSKVETLSVRGCSQQDYWSEVKTKLYEGIKSKGYSLNEEGENWAIFSNKDVQLTVDGGSCISIKIKAIEKPGQSVLEAEAAEAIEYDEPD